MSEELELKYSIRDARAVRRWLDATFPPAPDQRWRTYSIADRYLDAADGALSAAGYGVRLRRTGGRTMLTVKADIEVAGAMHRREELEAWATDDLDPGSWPESEARQRLLSVVGDGRLIERFVVRVRRRERSVTSGGALLLASVDDGRVETAGIDAGPIAQFEIERVSGRRAALARVAAMVETSGIGRPESRSKLGIAAGMSAEAARVRADDQFAEAGRKVMRRHLLRMLDREVGTRATDTLALKQMRVATRRLRATWRVFADGFKRGTRRRFVDDLRILGRALGAVRDRDVLLATVADEPALTPLADIWRGQREAAFGELMAILEAPAYAEFVADALEFTSTPGAGASRAGSHRDVAATAPGALRAAYDRLLEGGAAVASSDDPAIWHALRIEGRRFRYSLEAFADVLGAPATAELIANATRLQDHLGAMNDAAVAVDAVSAWLAETPGERPEAARSAAEAYIGRRQAATAELRQSYGTVWQRLADDASRTLLEHAIAALGARPAEALTQR